jgi:hypothetical protein
VSFQAQRRLAVIVFTNYKLQHETFLPLSGIWLKSAALAAPARLWPILPCKINSSGNLMASKLLPAAAASIAVAVAAYWYWSPLLTVRQLQSAAQSRDAEAFNAQVDYPRLRENIKGQLSALMAEKMGKTAESDNPFAALGSMIGMAVANPLVDAMVQPETVMQAMRSGEFGLLKSPQTRAPAPAPADGSPAPQSSKPKWTYERQSVNQLIVYAIDPKKPEASSRERTGLVFERSGFADWKLTNIRLAGAGS